MGRSIRVESWKSMKHGRIVWGGMLEPSNAGNKRLWEPNARNEKMKRINDSEIEK